MGFVEVPVVARRVLEVPIHLPGVGVKGERAVGVEVVAWSRISVHHRHRIAGAPDHLVGLCIVSAGQPDCAATGLPGVVVALPGLAARFAGRRNGVGQPFAFARRGIKGRDPAAPAGVAAGSSKDDLVLHDKWRAGVAHLRANRT